MFRLKNRLLLALLTAAFTVISVTVPTVDRVHVSKGNIDGVFGLSETDVTGIMEISAGLARADTYAKRLGADVDEDGCITVKDAKYTLLAALGIIPLGDASKLASYGITLTAQEAEAPQTQQSGSQQSQQAIQPQYVQSGSTVSYVDAQKIYIYPDMSQLLQVKDYFIIVTYGYGHCVGMSQYGAVSMARMGYDYIQILQYYYCGVQIAQEPVHPTVSVEGEQVDTVEMLARIVEQEIAGLCRTNDSLDMQALRAQAVAAYTNMKYSDYRVQGCTYVSSLSRCRDDVIQAAKEVAGQFIMYNNEPIYAYYGAMSAGVTANCEAIWNTSKPYIANVPSYWDCNESTFIGIKLVTPDSMRNYIKAYDSSIQLSDDPSQWLRILTHDDAVNETTGYVYSMRVGDRTIQNRAGMVFRDEIMDYSIKSPCFNIIYNGQFY